MTIHELHTPIDVHCPKGYGKAIAWIDYGVDTNTVWKIRLYDSGKVINVYDDEVLIYPNYMSGEKDITIPENWKK